MIAAQDILIVLEEEVGRDLLHGRAQPGAGAARALHAAAPAQA